MTDQKKPLADIDWRDDAQNAYCAAAIAAQFLSELASSDTVDASDIVAEVGVSESRMRAILVNGDIREIKVGELIRAFGLLGYDINVTLDTRRG